MNPDETDKIDVWFNGLTFLRKPQVKWESNEVITYVDEDDTELVKVNIISSFWTNPLVQLTTNVFCWNRLKRIVTRVLQAV